MQNQVACRGYELNIHVILSEAKNDMDVGVEITHNPRRATAFPLHKLRYLRAYLVYLMDGASKRHKTRQQNR
jgi:hypothetical protein